MKWVILFRDMEALKAYDSENDDEVDEVRIASQDGGDAALVLAEAVAEANGSCSSSLLANDSDSGE